jgi:hypothetical protein
MEGVLYAFDNAIDSEPTRTLTLTGAISSRAPTGELVHPVEGYGLLILQASEIDYLLVGYEHHKTLEGARRALARPKGIPRAGRAGKRPA